MGKTNPDRIVLVVDDQKGMCWVLSKILSGAGYSVRTAESAGEALAIARGEEVRAAIIDYRLPDRNGCHLFADLRQVRPSLIAVLITSYGSNQLREEALKLGFLAYFDKPFPDHLLLEVLKGALDEI